MTISQRGRRRRDLRRVCTGRFYDFFEKRDGRWGLVLRQPIYEKDRLDPVDPSAKLALDEDVLESFPEGYRHLAYLQKDRLQGEADMPGLEGPDSTRSMPAVRAGFPAVRCEYPPPRSGGGDHAKHGGGGWLAVSKPILFPAGSRPLATSPARGRI